MKQAFKIYAGGLVLIVLGAGLASLSVVPLRILGVALIIIGAGILIVYNLLTLP